MDYKQCFAVKCRFIEFIENLPYAKEFIIDRDSKLSLGNRKIFIDKDGGMILNWYGTQKSYKYIPLYQVLKMANGEMPPDNYAFENNPAN